MMNAWTTATGIGPKFYVIDPVSRQVFFITQMREGNRDTLFWGQAEFIAAEELSRQRGYWWSRDGRQLLALRVDESGVGIKTRAQILADRTELVQQRYPAAGEANAQVTAHVIDVASGQQRALPLPKNAEYIARAGWFADGTPSRPSWPSH